MAIVATGVSAGTELLLPCDYGFERVVFQAPCHAAVENAGPESSSLVCLSGSTARGAGREHVVFNGSRSPGLDSNLACC